MKIILDGEDIKNLIKKNYNGITDITLPDKLEITVSVDSESFVKVQKQLQNNINTAQTIPPIVKQLTPDEKNELEAKKGTMASGGVKRALTRIG